MARRPRWEGHVEGTSYLPFVSGTATSEFIRVTDICLRCGDRDARCRGAVLGGDPLAEHYDAEGDQIQHPTCGGPQ